MSYWFEVAIATTNPTVIELIKDFKKEWNNFRIECDTKYLNEAAGENKERWQADIDRIKSGEDTYGLFNKEVIKDVHLFTTSTNKISDLHYDLYNKIEEIAHDEEEGNTEICIVGEEGETERYAGNFNWIYLPNPAPQIVI